MKTSELRSRFLFFFEQRQHAIVASSSLVPNNDNTLLFTNAGMVQFKDVFLGMDKRDYQRATSSQRCVRAGGKHNDLENVGYTARHHTFFEMLGNFSFGDYFKEDAIRYAWAFLTEEIGLPKDKLWVTVFEEDDEAWNFWVNEIGIPVERIARIGAKDNFWQMGDTGPCGPCSEIFYDHGPEVAGGPPGTPEEDGDRYIEIWNLVFMQYDRAADGTLTPLPKPSVDTGMGLERIAAVLQDVHSNYEIDLFRNLISRAAALTGCEDQDSASLKVIADHIRSCAFLICDGVVPANEGRGYVLRRIIRRAARHGHKLGATEPFFYRLVSALADEMGDAYPELRSRQEHLESTLLAEEQKFNDTLASGIRILDEDIANLSNKVIPGDVLFKLYDTYGFPVDLTGDIARERGLEVDLEGFEKAMDAQRQRARSSNQFAADLSTRITSDQVTQFCGYDQLNTQTTISGLYIDGKPVSRIEAGDQAVVVLESTPFYGESGGQVGDTGVLQGKTTSFSVVDTQKSGATFTHVGQVTEGALALGDAVDAHVDADRRLAIIRHHSATHLLHAALRQFLGTHVEQRGSLVSPDYLRFDFSHTAPVTDAELADVERWVNAQVLANHETVVNMMSMDDALKKGAMALFGEKYGDIVRVVELGPDSVELCGGTHVMRTGEIGLFRIRSETGVASGIRRVEAISGLTALDAAADDRATLASVAGLLKTGQDSIVTKLSQVMEAQREQSRELDKIKSSLAAQAGERGLDQAVEVAGVKLLCLKLQDVDNKALREMMDRMRDKLGDAVVVLGAVNGGRVQLVAGVAKSLTDRLKAGELVNHVAAQVGGKGGGRPDMAMAGGDQPDALDAALASVAQWVQEKLG
ncbi:MAG TPA: alanine--tRNA ligase [Gammaproteobacteria bacterium]|nr:alanine--tRNA ligase [Gammaproteobacteria bacterium]